MERPPDKTLTDYMVIAISPALIVTLVGSFVFFLLTVVYEGPYESRLKWCFGCFIFGAVGIGRISIEDGRERAMFFAVPLAIATMLAVSSFVKFPFLMNLSIIAIIWVMADRLVWDCTLIDEDEDASGEGLLAHIGPDPSPVPAGPARSGDPRHSHILENVGMSGAAAGNTATPERPADAGADSSERRLPTWWGRFVESRRKRHTPGLWVIYLSFIALPVFGLLHGMIDDADTRRQQHVFKLLVVYVASAMALLMTTSFLGLRRYLRQRRLEMPLDMAGTWLGVGGAMTVALLVFASLLPRPTATENVIDIAWRLTSPDDHEPSKMGQGKDGVDKEGPASDTEKGGKTANEGKAEKGESSEAGDKGQDGSKGKESQQASEKGSRPEASPPSAPILSNLMEMLGTLLKWLLLAAVIAGGIYWAYKNREMVVAAWRKFLQELRDFWNRLFGRRGTDAAPAEATPVAGPSAKPFALFDNPFATGMAERLSPDELVKYSFEAMEAWAREHGCERKEQQTPHEFGREVARQNGSMAAEAVTIAELYSRVAYAKGSLTKAAVKHVEQLWSRLGSTPA